MLHASTLGGLPCLVGVRASYLDAIHSVQSVPETYPSEKGNPPILDFSSPGLADSIPNSLRIPAC